MAQWLTRWSLNIQSCFVITRHKYKAVALLHRYFDSSYASSRISLTLDKINLANCDDSPNSPKFFTVRYIWLAYYCNKHGKVLLPAAYICSDYKALIIETSISGWYGNWSGYTRLVYTHYLHQDQHQLKTLAG